MRAFARKGIKVRNEKGARYGNSHNSSYYDCERERVRL